VAPIKERPGITRKEGSNFILRCLSIAFTLTLHTSLFIWLTIPPTPLNIPLRASQGVEPLLVVFIATPQREALPTKPLSNANEINKRNAAYAETRKALKRSDEKHAAFASQASSAPSSEPVQAQSYPTPPSSPPPDISYGNSSFERALNDSQSGGLARVPGDDDIRKVVGIHVQTPPSIAQSLNATGHWLRCKDAIFKGRMTDEQLAQRGLTERQMLQKYVEEGCP
jgi:hypothetical protein